MSSTASNTSPRHAAATSSSAIRSEMRCSCSRSPRHRQHLRPSDDWVMRWITTVALVAGTVGLGAMGVLGQPAVPAPTHLGGAYWKQLSAGEKQAYLAGFLAGAA